MSVQYLQHSDIRDALIAEAQAMKPMLFSIIDQVTRRKAVRGEILQEVYERILSLPAAQERISNSRAWIIRSAKNAAIDWKRHKTNQEITGLDDDLEEYQPLVELGPEEIAVRNEMIERIARAVKRLPLMRRQVFVMRKVYGYRQTAIAAHFGITVNTVDQHLQHAVRDLAKHLNREIL